LPVSAYVWAANLAREARALRAREAPGDLERRVPSEGGEGIHNFELIEASTSLEILGQEL